MTKDNDDGELRGHLRKLKVKFQNIRQRAAQMDDRSTIALNLAK